MFGEMVNNPLYNERTQLLTSPRPRKVQTEDTCDLIQRNITHLNRISNNLGSEAREVEEMIRKPDEMKTNAVVQKSKTSQYGSCFLEVSVRIVLFIIFIQLERTPAFKRKIQTEELWLYKNPPTNDYVPASILMPASFVVPFTIICLNFLISHDRNDFTQANNAVTLALCINGLLTSLLKITIGRPRPDFYYRCYPDGHQVDPDMECNGDLRIVNDGRKSFPSGHSSFAFAGFGFVFLYLAAKLHVFNEIGRGQAWRLCVSTFPLVVALLVAISRTCDYHHHWQDVVVGSILGMTVTYVCYRQYYPSLFVTNAHRPFSRSAINGNCFIPVTDEFNEQKPLMEDEKDSKWI